MKLKIDTCSRCVGEIPNSLNTEKPQEENRDTNVRVAKKQAYLITIMLLVKRESIRKLSF